jgi:hypothetical protein
MIPQGHPCPAETGFERMGGQLQQLHRLCMAMPMHVHDQQNLSVVRGQLLHHVEKDAYLCLVGDGLILDCITGDGGWVIGVRGWITGVHHAVCFLYQNRLFV